MKEAIIYKARGGVLRLECGYNPEFVRSLKRVIPLGERAWDPKAKCWIITTDNVGTLRELCKDYFEYVSEKLD